MRAIRISEHGGIETEKFMENVPEPKISDTQVLVAVHAMSLNPIDYKFRNGTVEFANSELPITAGGDFSGIVVQVGNAVTTLNPGDPVYGYAVAFNGGSGAFADLVASNENNTAIKPRNTTFFEAAALPLAGTSAIQSLEELIKLKNGQKILIHGGAGGIGSIAIQIAKKKGAFIATTASEADIPFVKEIGADIALDYKAQNFDEILRDYDAVFDTVGGETYRRSFSVIKRGGVINSMLESPNEDLMGRFDVRALSQFTITNSMRLDRLAEYVNNGDVKPYIDRTFAIDNIQDAFTYFESGHHRGKVVLRTDRILL
ncbi:MAG: NADP-dependent oxidoreductase [Fibrobacter sp.]|nr:NADP-dependent oxidoreductase [Fibrobacter sp.]